MGAPSSRRWPRAALVARAGGAPTRERVWAGGAGGALGPGWGSGIRAEARRAAPVGQGSCAPPCAGHRAQGAAFVGLVLCCPPPNALRWPVPPKGCRAPAWRWLLLAPPSMLRGSPCAERAPGGRAAGPPLRRAAPARGAAREGAGAGGLPEQGDVGTGAHPQAERSFAEGLYWSGEGKGPGLPGVRARRPAVSISSRRWTGTALARRRHFPSWKTEPRMRGAVSAGTGRGPRPQPLAPHRPAEGGGDRSPQATRDSTWFSRDPHGSQSPLRRLPFPRCHCKVSPSPALPGPAPGSLVAPQPLPGCAGTLGLRRAPRRAGAGLGAALPSCPATWRWDPLPSFCAPQPRSAQPCAPRDPAGPLWRWRCPRAAHLAKSKQFFDTRIQIELTHGKLGRKGG